MGRILTGSIMLLFVLIVNVMIAFITTGAGETPLVVQEACGDFEPSGNETEDFEECEQVGKQAFLAMLAQVTISGLPGAPLMVNVLYLTIMGFLAIVGLLLVATGFLPFTSE